ncbi:hypothetical protein [Paractinoplanes toevensis]|uniref:Uncharacterized protein n=1 Tax=Paractinoplanes toevensis TaxID=571911 RepID=A0A919TB74_9ACTN|nr:hypothetical protein [Actinoplanes toevensis]GIM92438.1 hypothetical protein Ato02nite_042310 [Actinoplanes toevensis]
MVALLMPSLLLLSRTRLYPTLRTVLAGAGIALAAARLAERTTLVSGNPLEPVAEQLTSHPVVITGTLLAAAVAAWSRPALRVPAGTSSFLAPRSSADSRPDRGTASANE